MKLLVSMCCLLGLALAGPRVPLKNLMQFLEHEHELSRQDPQRSLVCFDCYLPLLTVIAEEFETSYAACLETATAAKERLHNTTMLDRQYVSNSMQSSCNHFTSCNELTDAMEYFECYANAGSENMKFMHAASSNATAMLTKVREQYRSIESEEHRCENNSEREYVKKTGSTYALLQKCLQDSAHADKDDTTTTASAADMPKPVATSTVTATDSSINTKAPVNRAL